MYLRPHFFCFRGLFCPSHSRAGIFPNKVFMPKRAIPDGLMNRRGKHYELFENVLRTFQKSSMKFLRKFIVLF